MPLKVVPRRDRKLNRVVKKGRTIALKRGEILFEPGDPARELYMVREGHLRLSHPGTGGGDRTRTVAIIGPWEMGGEKGLLPGAPRDFRALAGEESVLTLLDGPSVRRALQTAEKTFDAFLRAKEAEVALARALTGYRRPGGAGARLGRLLTNLMDRLGSPGKKGIRIPLRITHQLLADLSVSHRSTVTTHLNDWIYRNILLEVDGHLEILKPDALTDP